MISNLKESSFYKQSRWHPWFAWYPVRLYEDGDDHHWRTVWWERLERQKTYGYGWESWHYRRVKEPSLQTKTMVKGYQDAVKKFKGE